MDTVEYLGQANCKRLSNGTVEVVVTTDIGPRVIRYGFPGGDNILGECPDAVVTTDLGDWRPWGGHRLWTAPEGIPRSYVPDNDPIEFEPVGDLGIRLRPALEQATGIQKEMTVTLAESGTTVTVGHTITNAGLWEVPVAPWALSIMNGGGCVIIPQEPFIPHSDYLLPARPLVLWHYTNLADPRFTLGARFLQLRTDDDMDEPQKVGVANKREWAAYLRQGTLFVKKFPYDDGAAYPDGGCNCETFTKNDFIELETVGRLVTLGPGESAEHVETWSLFQGVDPGEGEAALEAAIMPLVEQAK
jgi:hypothetical protein